MPEWVIDWGVPAALLGVGIGVIKALLNRSVQQIDQSLKLVREALQETKRELREDYDGKIRGLHHRITEMKEDISSSERETLASIDRLKTKISDVQAETAKEFVRNQVFETVLTDVRMQFKTIDEKLTQLLRRA